MESLIPEIQKEIEKIAKNHSFKNFSIDITNTAANEGDGYIGIVEALCIKDKDSDKKLNLILKRAPSSANLRKQFPVGPAFSREIYMYEKLFPEFVSFQTQHNIAKIFNNFPKLYGCVKDEQKETVFMENLKASGFKLTDRKTPLDENHLNLVLKTYARLHAISHAMKKLEPEKFRMLTERIKRNVMLEHHNPDGTNPWDEFKQDQEKLEFDQRGKEVFKPCLSTIVDRPDLTSELEKSISVVNKYFLCDVPEMHKDQYAVVTHSDCWSANILFKYEDESNPDLPTDINLIDWQMSVVSHPIHDMSYFFFITAGKADLDNYKKYLLSYYEALCENLDAFGIDAKSFYPFELLEEHWKKYSKCGFFMCLVMLQQSLSEIKTHDFSKMADGGENIFDLGSRQATMSELFKKRMADLVEFVVENRLIQE